jgi:hypothetical protein
MSLAVVHAESAPPRERAAMMDRRRAFQRCIRERPV